MVTGAANGIGLAVAERLTADGFRVVGIDRESADAAPSIVADVAEIAGHEALVDRIESTYGAVSVLVNVAGVYIAETLHELSEDAYRRQLGVMLDGPIFLARAAGLRMAARGGGRIVNVTSVHSLLSERSSLAYDVAKGGLEAATRNLALELGRSGVLVNSVAPGFVRTRMSVVDGVNELDGSWFRDRYADGGLLPLGRAAEPSEIAATISFLVSSDNTYVTGARILADGGLSVTF